VARSVKGTHRYTMSILPRTPCLAARLLRPDDIRKEMHDFKEITGPNPTIAGLHR
jgi:hypothetical protein